MYKYGMDRNDRRISGRMETWFFIRLFLRWIAESADRIVRIEDGEIVADSQQ